MRIDIVAMRFTHISYAKITLNYFVIPCDTVYRKRGNKYGKTSCLFDC